MEPPLSQIPDTIAGRGVVRRLFKDGTVRSVRLDLGFSQAELAEAVGVDESSWSRWESGTRTPRAEVADRAAGVVAGLFKISNDGAAGE